MKVETGYGETWLGNIPDRVRRAEEAGFDAITTGELKHNSILALTLAAEHSEQIELCTGVTIAFPRTPMIMAQTAWDLQEFSKGRINIGLGSQVKGHIERRFGGTWTTYRICVTSASNVSAQMAATRRSGAAKVAATDSFYGQGV